MKKFQKNMFLKIFIRIMLKWQKPMGNLRGRQKPTGNLRGTYGELRGTYGEPTGNLRGAPGGPFWSAVCSFLRFFCF